MAVTGNALRKALPYLERLPDNTFFDTRRDGDDGGVVQFQASTLDDVHTITRALHLPRPWKKHFVKSLKWWEYTNEHDGLQFCIYAVKQAPTVCTAIVEKRQVEKRVPTAFAVEMVTEEVVVGWKCGDEREGVETT